MAESPEGAFQSEQRLDGLVLGVEVGGIPTAARLAPEKLVGQADREPSHGVGG